MSNVCFHCGLLCGKNLVDFNHKIFCCIGCKTVYEIFLDNKLTGYYDLDENPGIVPNQIHGKFDFLNNIEISKKLLEYTDDKIQIVNLHIPQIHCSSCIWVLENLNKLHKGVKSAQVNFPKKKIRITYSSKNLSLKGLVVLLASIGYEPYISLDDYDHKEKALDRSIIYKLGIAGFAFGNIMFLSFPEYFEVDEFWLNQYKPFFRYLMLFMSFPVIFYAASDYFISAYKGIKTKTIQKTLTCSGYDFISTSRKQY